MDTADLSIMMQSTLGLVGIVTDQRDHDPEKVMSGIMRLTSQIEEAYAEVTEEMRGEGDPDRLITAMTKPNILAAQYHADDLLAVTTRASKNFGPLLGDEGAELSPAATGDVLAWLSIAGQTLIALKLLFQASRLYGRAPNGRLLPRST